jgi:predicted RNase H-like HicB family nuclease
VNLQCVGHSLHLDAWQLTELHRLELELQAVLPHFRSTRSRHRTPPLGGSVYSIEARSGVRSIALLDSRPGWYIAWVTFTIEIEREDDGRWLAEVPALSGVMAYGQDRDEAVARVQALALRVIAERLEHREVPAEFLNVTFQAA